MPEAVRPAAPRHGGRPAGSNPPASALPKATVGGGGYGGSTPQQPVDGGRVMPVERIHFAVVAVAICTASGSRPAQENASEPQAPAGAPFLAGVHRNSTGAVT